MGYIKPPPQLYQIDWMIQIIWAKIGVWKIFVFFFVCRQHLEPHVATTIEFCDTSTNIWDTRAENFSQQSSVSQVYKLLSKDFAGVLKLS